MFFSLCHNHDESQILAHYALHEHEKLRIHHCQLVALSLSANDGEYLNLPYPFVENVYKIYGPIHLNRIREAAETEWPSDAKHVNNEDTD